MVFESGFVCD